MPDALLLACYVAQPYLHLTMRCCGAMPQVVLEVKGESQLRTLSGKLTEAGVKHKLWVEQPEDYPTCLATKPYHKSEIAQHFKKFQLCKAALS